MAGKPRGATRRDLYRITDSAAFADWVASIVSSLGGASMAAKVLGIHRPKLYEWMRVESGGTVRREIHHAAVESMVMASPEPAYLERGWWLTASLSWCADPPTADASELKAELVESVRRGQPQTSTTDLSGNPIVLPFHPKSAAELFGDLGIARLRRGEYPFREGDRDSRGTLLEHRWPVGVWIACDAPTLATFREQHRRRAERESGSGMLFRTSDGTAAGYVAFRWPISAPAVQKAA